ncbi:MAG: TIGR03936 family radical SAM-associated protein [Planctomycetes bacterium]|nr:TIGR03936 family radical SAM-associated protein [Planctomycetota bacterium]
MFSKSGPACLLSNLDLQEALETALRRARLPLAYSDGYHPRPKMSFEDALPLGWESEAESVWLELSCSYPVPEARRRLQHCLPPGIEIVDLFHAPKKSQPTMHRRFRIQGLKAGVMEGIDFSSWSGNFAWHCIGRDVVLDQEPDEQGKGPASLRRVLAAQLGESELAKLSVCRLKLELIHG